MAAVQAADCGLSVVDIVGALSAMGVFDMGAPTDQTDPSRISCRRLMLLMRMRRRLYLANMDENPLDLSRMTAVTNAVDAIEVIKRGCWC